MTSFYYQLQLMLILPMLFLSACYKPMIILNGFLYKEVQKQLWVTINRPILSGKGFFHLGSPVTAYQNLAFHQQSGSDSVSPMCRGNWICSSLCLVPFARSCNQEIEFILFNAELEHQNAAAEGFIRDFCDLSCSLLWKLVFVSR